MFSRRSLQRLTAAAVLVGATFVAVNPIHADTVDDKRRQVAQIVNQLDALDEKISQTNEEYLEALGRQDQLERDITTLQAQVDEEQGRLGELEDLLTRIAIDRYTNHGSTAENPLLTSRQTFADDQQRQELTNAAINAGLVDTDDVQAVVDELSARRRDLDAKKQQAADLVAYLETRQQQLDAMTDDYNARRVKAERELGDAIHAEEERRAQEQLAAAQQRQREAEAAAAAARSNQQAAAARPNRGGGATTSGGGSGGTSSTGGSSGGSSSSGSSNGGSSNTSAPPPNIPAPAGNAGIAVSAARAQLGVPYRYAASIPGVAFDCSGLTAYAWGRAGIYLPHQSARQYAVTPHVPKASALPGDLVFFYSPISHVGIYIGGGMMIHAPRTGDVVKVASVNWSKSVGVSRPR